MTESQQGLLLAFILLTAWFIYLLSPILMPFAFASMLAYLGDPLADKLEVLKIKNHQLGRTPAVLVVFSLMLFIISMLLIILIPTLEFQISQLLHNLPAYSQWLNSSLIPVIEQHLGISLNLIEGDSIITVIKSHWQKAGQSALVLMGSVSHSGKVIIEWLMNLVLIPVITFYLLRDWDTLVVKIHHLLPRRASPTATKLAIETNAVLGEFIRGQFYVMIALGTIYSLGLWLTGLNLALLIGMMAGLVSFVPYLGAIIGIIVACLAAMLQFQDASALIPVCTVFIVGQSLEGMLLTPMLVGDKIGLHPVAVIFAVLAGGQLCGFLGVLLALPIASVLMVFLRHIHGIYQDSDFYCDEN